MLNESLPLFIRLCLFRTNLCDWNLKQGIVLRLQAFLTLITEKGLPLEDTIDSFRIITVLFWAELSKSSEKSHNVNNNDKWITILNNKKKILSPWFWFGHLSLAESCTEAEQLSNNTYFRTKATRMDYPLAKHLKGLGILKRFIIYVYLDFKEERGEEMAGQETHLSLRVINRAFWNLPGHAQFSGLCEPKGYT